MSTTCTTTTKSGLPCQAPAIRWPYGADGNPHLCAKHAPAHLREMRDVLFAEEAQRHAERLGAREPECWSWDPTIPLDRIVDEFGWDAECFTSRFRAREDQALRIALAAWHRRRCAVCGFCHLPLVDDHDHDTGLIRGLLCRSCNGKEPHDDGLFRKYRERPPAQILGIHLRYWDPRHGWARSRAIGRRQLDSHPAYALAARLGARLRGDDGPV